MLSMKVEELSRGDDTGESISPNGNSNCLAMYIAFPNHIKYIVFLIIQIDILREFQLCRARSYRRQKLLDTSPTMSRKS